MMPRKRLASIASDAIAETAQTLPIAPTAPCGVRDSPMLSSRRRCAAAAGTAQPIGRARIAAALCHLGQPTARQSQ
jgi:hypothetical protein